MVIRRAERWQWCGRVERKWRWEGRVAVDGRGEERGVRGKRRRWRWYQRLGERPEKRKVVVVWEMRVPEKRRVDLEEVVVLGGEEECSGKGWK